MMENLGRYYEWADNRVITLLESLDEESFAKVPEGIQRSIRDLAEHLIVYYEYYAHRDRKVPFKSLQAKLKKMDKAGLLNHWKQALKDFSEALENTGEDSIDIPLPNGKTTGISRESYIFAFTDHATYHRGQLITVYKAITGKNAVASDYYDFLTAAIKNT